MHNLRVALWDEVIRARIETANDLASKAAGLYARYRTELCFVYQDVEPALSSLHERFHLGLITTGNGSMQRSRIQYFGLEGYFEVILVSGEVGISKPDPAIFGLALDKLDAEPQHTWHIGDSLTSDVAGAKAVGLTAVWLNRHSASRPADAPVPDYEISSLSELQALLLTP